MFSVTRFMKWKEASFTDYKNTAFLGGGTMFKNISLETAWSKNCNAFANMCKSD